MKKFLTILAIFMSTLCGSVLLVSCSSGYKKMYLQVEYAVYDADGKFEGWKELENGMLDYTMSSNLYSEDNEAYILNLRVKVKGTSKNVSSLYVSQSANNSTVLRTNNVKPDEAFMVLVKNIGSVSFTVTPSHGGEGKSIKFGLNIYRELEKIEQNTKCVPGVVLGGYVHLDKLTNLIKYYPFNDITETTETNRTGVDFTIDSVGRLKDDGQENLIDRTFIPDERFSVSGDGLALQDYNLYTVVRLQQNVGSLGLHIDSRYKLTSNNNVIKLTATSRYDSEKTTSVYVFIVENFKERSLLVSYREDIELDANGDLPVATIDDDLGEIDKDEQITIYDALTGSEYRSINVYTYTSRSIYSFIGDPGITLTVYVNDQKYNYKEIAESDLGIKITPADTNAINSIGIKIETNPLRDESYSENQYDIKLELDFTAFDFSASDTAPVEKLHKSFSIRINSLANSFLINDKTYVDNLLNEDVGTSITYSQSNEEAKLYSKYVDALGMPLRVQAVPTDAEKADVGVRFYSSLTCVGGVLTGNELKQDAIRLRESQALSVQYKSDYYDDGGAFVISRQTGRRLLYLSFEPNYKIDDIDEIYAVFRVQSTPDEFNGNKEPVKYITFIAKITVVGAVEDAVLYSDAMATNVLDDEYLQNGVSNTAYVDLKSNSSDVDLDEIVISSAKGKIRYLSNEGKWVASLTAEQLTRDGGLYRLHFKSTQECTDSIIMQAPNGLNCNYEYIFVNVTDTSSVTLTYDESFVWNADVETSVRYEYDETTEYSVNLQYLALQSGKSSQFVAKGGGKTDNIAGVSANRIFVNSSDFSKLFVQVGGDWERLYPSANMMVFSSTAITIPTQGDYWFDVRANTVGATAVLFVKVDYYVKGVDEIQPATKYFLYEIATYTPARDLAVTVDQDSLLYINDNYKEVAQINFQVNNNTSSATKQLTYSNERVNEMINATYGSADSHNIYGIEVDFNAAVEIIGSQEEFYKYFEVTGLNSVGSGTTFISSTRRLTLTALESLKPLQDKGINSFYIDFAIHQFGVKSAVNTYRQLIYFGDYDKAAGIVVDGVDRYNNLYISLLDAGADGASTYITATTTNNATYSELGYELEIVTLNDDGTIRGSQKYAGDHLIIRQTGSRFDITAKTQGDVYKLRLYTKDSYDNESKTYTTYSDILITVSDGASEATAYLIGKLDDFIKMAKTNNTNKYYRLSADVDLSALSTKGYCDNERVFNGHLNGAMTINNLVSGATISKRYALTNLTIDNSYYSKVNDTKSYDTFGLFNIIAENATIKNVVFDAVKLDISLNKDNTSGTVCIGVIAGISNGKIENCSINLASDKSENKAIKLIKQTGDDSEDQSAIGTTYNIGLVVGQNKGDITYDSAEAGNEYAYMLNVKSGAKLSIVAEYNTNLNSAIVNIGGISGENNGNISAGYEYVSGQTLRDIITGVVDIEFSAECDATKALMTINTSIGGAVGYNAGNIEKIAISGSIVANDKVNIGGVVGHNAGDINECANYGMVLEGSMLADATGNTYHGSGANQEQNIGGIIGYNESVNALTKLRTMFVLFEDTEIGVEASRSFIKGVGNVAGIIGKMKQGVTATLILASVENFVNDDNHYNIIGGKANVAGLLASGADGYGALIAYASFVQADFDIGVGSTFYEFCYESKLVACGHLYFIGDIFTDGTGNELSAHNTPRANTYIVNNIIKLDGSVVVKEYGVNNITDIGAEYIYNYNGTKVIWSKTDGVNGGYPYISRIMDVDVGAGTVEAIPTLTIQPSEIYVTVDQDYFKEDDVEELKRYIKGEDDATESGVYVRYTVDNKGTLATADDDTKAVAVVYYYKNGNNVYDLVTNDGKYGLIEKSILPSLADGSYSVNIIAGQSIARLIGDGTKIEFLGTGRVEIRFVSIYNRDVRATAVIFVENPLHNDTFDLISSAGLATIGQNLTTSLGQNSTLDVQLKSVDGETFDNTKLYMTNKITATKNSADAISDEDISDNKYFKLVANTKEIESGIGIYPIGSFGLTTTDVDWSEAGLEKVTIELTVSIYLNLSKYTVDGKSLKEWTGENGVLLDEQEITIIVFNKATDLTVTGLVKAEAGVSVDVTANLITNYIGDQTNNWSVVGGTKYYAVDDGRTGVLTLSILNQDAIYARLTAENKNAEDLAEKARLEVENAGKNFTMWELFDTIVSYKRNDLGNGYFYKLNVRLKEKYRALRLEGYTEHEWKFKIKIVAQSNSSLTAESQVYFVPQPLTTFRIESYTNLVAKTGSDNHSVTAEFVSYESESSMIIPGRSGLVKIFAESTYSYFDNISITSSTTMIDGQEYFVRFQQMVYDREAKVYRSYAGVTADGTTLGLVPVSYINQDGTYEYSGVIFVRTILDNIVGVRKTFTYTVNANTYDIDGNVVPVEPRTKTVLSQYMPGVYINVNNALESSKDNAKIYLVERGSSNVEVVARVYGYEFNVEPNANIKDATGKEIPRTEISLMRSDIEKGEDGAYIITYTLGVSIERNELFKLNLNMSLIENGNTLIAESSVLTFYPVEYILTDTYLSGEANGALNISINSSKTIDMIWSTTSAKKKSDEINNKLLSMSTYLDMFYIKAYDEQGRVYDKKFTSLLDVQGDTVKFVIKRNGDGTYRIEGMAKNSTTVYFDLWYGYDLTDGTVKFSSEKDVASGCTNLLSHQFVLNIVVKTEEKAPRPIYDIAGLMAMDDGENYILMNDLILENWTPLTTPIASLDGNGKLITIRSFDIAVQTTTNVGLFATIDENAIIKNVAINIAYLSGDSNVMYIKDDNTATAVLVNFGLLAGVNNGLVYNCEIVSVYASKSLTIELGAGYKMKFGSLVGVNNGNITNSRVGNEYFDSLTLASDNVTPISNIKSCGTISIISKGIIGGFVGVNSANSIISSCYVANSSFENTSNANIDNNKTAGFAGINNGTIAYSYSKGLEKTILDSGARTTDCKVYASGLGSVAGFVFENTGIIHDCYSNIICQSSSAVAAGFVYDSSSTGSEVYQCYTASSVKSDATDVALVTQLPFVGVGVEKDNAQQLLASKGIANCFYLDDGSVEYDTGYYVADGVVEPVGVSLAGFANPSVLNNFSFISTGSQEQQLNAVWTYSTALDKNKDIYYLGTTQLPELTSANRIARSIRKNQVDEYGHLKTNNYAQGYDLGSSVNPYIVRSVDEYETVFNEGVEAITNKFAGYVRFIDNISFKIDSNNYVDISTRSNYKLGDFNNKLFTVIDGNGMTLSDVVINYSPQDEENAKIGLFGEIYYSLVKGLAVKYTAGEASTRAAYTGGLAGVATNTYFIDITLDGEVTLHAHNIVGGLVGQLNGAHSGLYNISSTLSVKAGAGLSDAGAQYVHNINPFTVSYAGGIVGIVDNYNGTKQIEINKINVTGANVEGLRAGGVAGYLSSEVDASRVNYWISSNSQVLGIAVAGGLVAENAANIEFSQVAMDIDTQYVYDKAFADYINSDELTRVYIDNGTEGFDSTNNTSSTYGNLSAVSSQGIAGGFVGINTIGRIHDSLTKANIGPSQAWGIPTYIGGFVGKMIGGSVQTAYAENFIYITDTDSKKDHSLTAGGFAGWVAKSSNSVGINEFVSAMFFDKVQLIDVQHNHKESVYIDALVGKLDAGVEFTSGIDNSLGTNINANYGQYNLFKYLPIEGDEYYDKYNGYSQNNVYDVIHTDTINASGKAPYKIENLYNLSAGDQKEIFESLFITWQTQYWDLDHKRFMPNLRVANDSLFIEIRNIDDLVEFKNHPDGNFILLNDVNIGDVYNNSNYIVDVDFHGTLVGKLQEGGVYPKFTNIQLTATNRASGAGFFRQTTGVRIANVGFDYHTLQLDTYDDGFVVGGVSSIDEPYCPDGTSDVVGSRFEHITVTQTSGGSGVESLDASDANVSRLGSICGSTKGSTIVGCTSTLSYNDVKPISNSYIGGLVGEITSSDVNSYDALISASNYNANMSISATNGVTVGGIAGTAQNTYIQSSNVYSINTDGIYDVSKITIADATNQNIIGGVVGFGNSALINDSHTKINVESVDEIDTETYIIGGIMGRTSNVAVEDTVDIKDCYTELTVNISNAGDVNIGGVVGSITKYITIDSVVVNLNIDDRNSAGANYLTIGGIVAIIQEGASGITSITNAVAYLNMCNAYYKTRLVGGGIIGLAYSAYQITNAMSVGQLFANNTCDTPTSTPTLTIMGGFVGIAGLATFNGVAIEDVATLEGQTIKSSYTVLTMSRAGVYKGSSSADYRHDIYTDPFIGYMHTDSSVTLTNVLYSSDYCLTFANTEQYDTTEYYNVAGNVLYGEAYLSANAKGVLSDYLGAGMLVNSDAIPTPRSVNRMLALSGIKNNEGKFITGSAFSPYLLTTDKMWELEDNVGEYYYYYSLIDGDNVFDDVSVSDFNGVLLGNNRKVTLTKTMFSNITKHSAVSNLKIELIKPMLDGFNGTASVAEKNEGTIFMCGVNYAFDSTPDRGISGIAGENNGVVAYCFNTGVATNIKSSSAGIVGINGVCGSVEQSYFSGSLGGVGDSATAESGALIYENSGNVENCYTAGQATNGFIVTMEETGRYSNNYFDMYATYVEVLIYTADEDGDGNTKNEPGYENGIEAVSTTVLQGVTENTNTSNKLGAMWSVYNMYSVVNGTASTTYNYGYPIHNVDQYVGFDNILSRVEPYATDTGNGTFVPIENIDELHDKLVIDAEEQKYDDHSFLINNIGVLSTINTLYNDLMEEGAKGKYFELNTRIVLPENYKDYVGGDDTKSDCLLAQWSSISNFQGIFSTANGEVHLDGDGNEYYELDAEATRIANAYIVKKDTDVPATPEDDKRIYIKNLRGEALFDNDNIDDCVIADIVLHSSKVKTAALMNRASGATVLIRSGIQEGVDAYGVDSIAGLIYNVKDNGTITINNMVYGEIGFNTTEEASTSCVAGVIDINNGIVKITGDALELRIDATTNKIAGVSGFINTNANSIVLSTPITINLNITDATDAGDEVDHINGFVTTNKGSITGEPITINVNSKYHSLTKITNISGFAGSIIGGEISTPVTVTMSQMSAENIAGLVGTFTGGTLKQADVTFNENPCEATTFAGAVSTMEGGTLGDKDATDPTITINLRDQYCYTFGGIVARYSAGNIDNVKVSADVETLKVGLYDGDDSTITIIEKGEAKGYGLIIGEMSNSTNGTQYRLNFKFETITKFVVNQYNDTPDGMLQSGAGIIVGKMSDAQCNFKIMCQQDEAISDTIELIAEGNAGGFAGYVISTSSTCSVTLTGKDEDEDEDESYLWPLYLDDAEGGYATIDLLEPKENEVLVAYNFGGLFGYIDGGINLSGTMVQNCNKVLTKTDSLNAFKYIDGNASASNIGGVVGKYVGNDALKEVSNIAQVGVGPTEEDKNVKNPNGKNPIFHGTLDKVYKFNYVGGVVGCLDGGVDKCSNSGKVYGQQYVGGLVGGGTHMSITADDTCVIGGTITGLRCVGGVLGGATGDKDKPIQVSKVSCNAEVFGVANVGGLVGYLVGNEANTDAKIENSTCSATVYGNLNVGAVVGLCNQITISNSSEIVAYNATVCGTVFDMIHSYKDYEGNTKFEYLAYLPTNIGGVVGLINGSNTTIEVKCDAYVTTESKFAKYTLLDDSSSETVTEAGVFTINMVANYIATGNGSDGQPLGMYGRDTANKKKVEEMSSGIGGFVGRMGSGNTLEGEATGDVYAPLGANVGGLIGYYVDSIASDQNPFKDLKIGTSGNPIDVAGRAFIGGYFGKINGGIDRSEKDENNEITSESVDKGDPFVYSDTSDNKAYINVQRYNTVKAEITNPVSEPVSEPVNEYGYLYGLYIGGVVGYSTGSIRGINLGKDIIEKDEASKLWMDKSDNTGIHIYNQPGGLTAETALSSSYVGVIVGRLDTDGTENTSADISFCTISRTACGMEFKGRESVNDSSGKAPGTEGWTPTYNDTWTAPYLPNIHPTDPKFEQKVSGGIIDNPLAFNYGGIAGVIVGSNAYVDGVHYYAFTIDSVRSKAFGTADALLGYDDDASESIATLTAIARYTGIGNFNIKASSLKTLYDGNNDGNNDYNPTQKDCNGWAEEYTLFRALYSQQDQGSDVKTGAVISELYSADCISEVGVSNKGSNKEIEYTVYTPFGGIPKYYSKRGIASYFDLDAVKAAYVGMDDDIYGDMTDGLPDFYKLDTAVNSDELYVHVELSSEEAKSCQKRLKDGKGIITDKKGRSCTLGYTYFNINNLDARTKGSLYLNKKNSDTYSGTYFKYDVVYDSALSSGSVFDVSGTMSKPEFEKDSGESSWWQWIVIGVLTIVAIVGAVFTCGASIAAYCGVAVTIGSAFTALGCVSTVIPVVVGLAGALVGAGVGSAISAGISGIVSFVINANAMTAYMMNEKVKALQTTEQILSSTYDTQMGLQHNVYARTIEISSGQVIPNSDEVLTFPVIQEIAISKVADIVDEEEEVWQTWLAGLGGAPFIDGDNMKLPIEIPYMYYANENAMPSDYMEQCIINVEELGGREGTGADETWTNLMCKALYNADVKEIIVPKYIKRNMEVYVCQVGGKSHTFKMLYPNYEELESSLNTEITSGMVVDNRGYVYRYDDGATGLCKDSEIADYLKKEYGINNTLSHNVKYSVISGTAPENSFSNRKIDGTIMWQLNAGGNVTATAYKYSKSLAVDWSGYTYIDFDTGNYILPCPTVKNAGGENVSGESVSIGFTATSSGTISTTTVEQFVPDLTTNYYLNVDNDSGTVEIVYEYYLYYPNLATAPSGAGQFEIGDTIAYKGTQQVVPTKLTNANKSTYAGRPYFTINGGEYKIKGTVPTGEMSISGNEYVAVVQEVAYGKYSVFSEFLIDSAVMGAIKDFTIASGLGMGATIGNSYQVIKGGPVVNSKVQYSMGVTYLKDVQDSIVFYYKPVIAKMMATVDAGYNYNKKHYALYPKMDNDSGDTLGTSMAFYTRYDYGSEFMKLSAGSDRVNNLLYSGVSFAQNVITTINSGTGNRVTVIK